MSTGWGRAQVEVDAAHDKIAKAMAAGQPLTEIYEGLKKDDRFSGGYKAFWKNVGKIPKSRGKDFRSTWGRARAEVIALRSQIRAALAEGRTLKSIYNELKAENRVSGTYQAFHINVKKFCGSPRLRGLKPTLALPLVQSGTTPPSTAPQPVSKPSTPSPPTPEPARPAPAFFEERVEREPVFKQDESITLEELI